MASTNGSTEDSAAAALQEARDKEVVGWVEAGFQAVNKHNLKEAENVLQKAWSGLRPDAPDADRLLVRTLLLLAEVYAKRGRSSKEEMESYWRYLKSITLQRMAIDVCEGAMEQRVSNNVYQWLVEKRDLTLDKVSGLEMHIVKLMYNRLMMLKQHDEMRKAEEEKKKKDGAGAAEVIVIESEADMWTSRLVSHCQQRLQDMCSKDETTDQDAELTETDSSASDKDESESEQKVEETEEERKLEFEKLQVTIQSLIRKMTFESKQQHLEDLKKAIANRNEESPGKDEDNEKGDEESRILKGIILSHRVSSPLPKTNEDDIDLEVKNEKSPDSPAEKNQEKKDSIMLKRKKVIQSKKKTVTFVTTPVPAARPTSLVPAMYHNEFKEAQKERSTNPNILRIWKAYKSPNQCSDVPHYSPHKLHTFEEVSPITEAFRFQNLTDTESVEMQNRPAQLYTPITEPNFNCTLAEIFARMAEKMFNERRLKDALKMYTASLGIFQTIPEQTSFMVKMAHVLKYIGMVKSLLGDVVGGCQIMEKSIDIFEKYPDSNVTINVAKVWFELGTAYMADQWNSESLFVHVTDTIHSELDDLHIFKNEYPEYSETDSEEDSEGSEECYSVCTKEAITCFTHTYELLNKLRTHGNKQHNELYAEVLTKLGDCSIMVGNYDQAVSLYEEALRLFRLTFGSSNLPENAHVLSMMGVANFLLKHYPQAATILECAHLMQHHIFTSAEDTTFEVAFTLTMLAITYYMMGQYHRCIQWCIKAHNIYACMFDESLTNVEDRKRWFIILTTFVLGFSYGTLNFYDKAIEQLMIARELCLRAEVLDRKQIVRIVKSLADVYSSMDDNDNALVYYNEALDYNIGYDEEDAAVLQNQLLNRTAGVHVNMKQYSAAAMYLEQALDVQKNLEDDIKGDLVTVLHQLGQTYALAGDIDKAIECYMECLEDYKEEHGHLTAVMCPTLANLACLCHVKGCLEDGDDGMKMLQMAESYYKQALELDDSAKITTMYANFLYYQGRFDDALYILLPYLYLQPAETMGVEIAFTGVELAILPEHMQIEIDELEEVFFDCNVFSKFLAVLCYKQLNLMKDADDCLVALYCEVQDHTSPLPHSMLGYILVEMGLLLEASDSFLKAAIMLDSIKSVAYSNFCVCLCMHAYLTMIKTLFKFLELANVSVLPQLRYVDRDQQAEASGQGTRDSGYYENKESELWTSTETVGTVTSQPSESDYHTQEEEVYTWSNNQTSCKPTAPSDLPLIHKTTDSTENLNFNNTWEETRSLPYTIDSSSQEFDNWEMSSTETIETPDAIMKSLSDQNYIRNLTNMSFLQSDECLLSPSTTDDDEWTITEETVETPPFLLSVMKESMQKEESRRKKQNSEQIVTVVEKVNKPIVWTSRMPDDKEPEQKKEEPPRSVVEPETSATDDEEEWTVFEETVETPIAILQQLQSSQVKDVPGQSQQHGAPENAQVKVEETQHEEWISEEVVMETPAAILQLLAISESIAVSTPSGGNSGGGVGKGDDGMRVGPDYSQHDDNGALFANSKMNGKADVASNESDEVHEWTVTEEVVETPAAILLALKSQQNTSSNQTRVTPEEEPEEQEEEWTVFEEEAVETPSSLLQALISRSNERFATTLHNVSNSVGDMYDEQSKLNAAPPTQDEEEEETWTVTEEVVETPAELLQVLMSRSTTKEENETIPREEEETPETEEWITSEEVVVDTPAFLLQSMKTQAEPEKFDSKAEEEKEDEEEWVVTEEVVDTPSAVLRALMEMNKTDYAISGSPEQTSQRSQGHRPTVTHSQESSSSHTYQHQGSSSNNVPYREAYRDSGESHTQQDGQTETSSSEWTVTEETVSTPSILLQAMMQRAEDRTNIVLSDRQDHKPAPPSGDTQEDMAEDQEWVIEEEVVEETPAVILEMLRRASSVSDVHQTAVSASTVTEGGLHAQKQSHGGSSPTTNINSPLSSSLSSSRYLGINTGASHIHHQEENKNDVDVYSDFDKAYTALARSSSSSSSPFRGGVFGSNDLNNEASNNSSSGRTESWTSQEVVVDTPLAILETIRNNNNRRDVQYTDNGHKSWERSNSNSQDSNVDDEYETTWVTTEEVVSTPLAILQTLQQKQQQQSQKPAGGNNTPMNVSPTSSCETSPDDEEAEQVWEMEETVVDTPAVLLALLAKS